MTRHRKRKKEKESFNDVETDIIFSRKGIHNSVIRKEYHENCSGDHKFVLLVDFLDHDDTVNAEGYYGTRESLREAV